MNASGPGRHAHDSEPAPCLAQAVRGEVLVDAASRGLYATDPSIYQEKVGL